jgi:hypothetical protein
MDQLTTFRLELGINAQKITQAFMSNNKQLEEVIEKAVTAGLEEFCNQENIHLVIKEKTKETLLNSFVNQRLLHWDLENAVSKAVNEKVQVKISEYANKLAEKITESLK